VCWFEYAKKEDRAPGMAWNEVGRFNYLGSPSAVGGTEHVTWNGKALIWFGIDKSVFLISAGTTTALSWFCSTVAYKFRNVNLPRPSKMFPIVHPDTATLPLNKL
jgi:hypothetical protein